VAVLAACAGAIHLAMAPIHAGDARRQAAAFAVIGALQVLGAGSALVWRRGRVVAATVALGVVAAAAWGWSRRWALPFDLGGPEDAGAVDGLTAAFELAALVVAVASRWTRRLHPWSFVPLHLAAAVATVVALASPSTAEHGGDAHSEISHDEPATSDGHGHGAAAEQAAACPEAGLDGPPVTDPPLDFPGERLAPDRAAALTSLAAASRALPCGAVAAAGGHGHGADLQIESPLAGDELGRFDEQWAAASAAALTLATPGAAAAAGYVQASPQAPGVGTHWIDWTLIDEPFDPARPSMVLYDERPGRQVRLVGFSYWTRSAPGAPDGFAGANDVWHQHVGLCFVEGWLFQEGVASSDRCAGDWLNGTDLWMLHAWVVPDLPNPDGRFAGRHRAVCPGDQEAVADAVTCDPIGN
jgi:hypothetical protein